MSVLKNENISVAKSSRYDYRIDGFVGRWSVCRHVGGLAVGGRFDGGQWVYGFNKSR